MSIRLVSILLLGSFIFGSMMVPEAKAYTANKVWFEFRPNGRYRVYVNYTIPSLKEYRESYSEFTQKKLAEKFYWDLVRGADFYEPDPEKIRFINQPQEPRPW